MDPITAKLMSAAGAAADPVYVDDVFSTFLYVGTNSIQGITNGIDLSGEGGMVWAKSRTGTRNHIVSDTERGTGKVLFTNLNAAEDADSTTIISYNSDGFTMGSSTYKMNTSGEDFCCWTFRKCPGFFDVVTWTGNGTSGRTISHNLGSVPGSIWVKRLSSSDNWWVYHRSTGNTKYLYLNSDIVGYTGSEAWNNTTPTASVFTVGNDTAVNANGETYVAYIFAHDEQSFGDNGNEAIIKCGSYSGNGSATGVLENLGFEPQWVLIKRTDSTESWQLVDSMRGVFTGGQDTNLEPNGSNQEQSSDIIQFEPTGFRPMSTDGKTNGSSGSYIYIAIRRPHKPPEAGTDVFQPDLKSSNQTITTDFPVDLCVLQYTGGGAPYWVDRMRGLFTNGTNYVQKYLNSASEAAQGNDTGTLGVKDFDSTSYEHSLGNFEQSTLAFKRAAGFFDIITYTGNATSNRSLSHNLNAVPEFMIGKRFTGAAKAWITYHKSFGYTKALELNSSTPQTDNVWAATPTSTSLTIDSNSAINTDANDYIIYLFATLAGISKVGSYTGTGNNIDVDCGFTAGARFVMIKRTDSNGDWFYWHTALGINSGNDPYLQMNSSGSKVTNTDYIDPLNAGFTVTSSAPAALNASSGTYIFLAIA